MKKAIGVLGVLVTGIVISASASAELPQPGDTPILQQVPSLQLVQLVPLACTGTGASDVVSRKHQIKNTTGFKVPKGTIVHWSASNKGTGSLTLNSDLAPNATVDVIQPGQTNGYTCTANFNPGRADLAVTSLRWTSATTAQVVIANLNPWVDAPKSAMQVRSLQCVVTPVALAGGPVPAIPKNSSVFLNVNIAHAGADYLEATANSQNTVPETNKTNNVLKSNDFYTNKSCTPQ